MAMAVVVSPATPAVGRAPAMFELADASPSCATLLSTLQRPPTHHPHVQPPASPLAAAPPATPPPQSAHAARGDQQHNGTAARLNDQLHSIQPQSKLGLGAANGEGAACSGAAISGEAGLRSRLQGYALRVGGMMQPSGEALGDATWAERTSNVLTSLPFLAIGVHMHRQRLTPEGRHHALSMVAVGAAATLYHASSGRARRFTRKLDYWTIAYTSSAMTKLLFSDTPGARRAANMSLLALPFRPFAVSAGHALVMQAEFARQATQHKAVRVDLRRHYTAALLGVAAFFGEDLITDSGYAGFVHSAWHCMAAYSMYTVNGLLVHKERQLLHRQLTGPPGSSGVAGGARPLRRPVHSSASSLPSYGTTPKAAAGTGWRTGTISP